MKLNASHLQRYKQIALLLWKYGRSDLVRQMRLDEAFPDPDEAPPTTDAHGTPDQLADDLETMGPTYVKLGQVLSSRPDLLPRHYVEALTRLQDSVKPFRYEDVEEIVQSELQVRISKAFSYFEREPMAAASLGQVHRAALRDGTEVVVKVQRPHITRQIADDFEVLSDIAQFLDARTELGRKHRFCEMLEEFRTTIQQELDYRREAENLAKLDENLEEFPLIRVPAPIPDYCTRRVLTMEYISGTKITKLPPIAFLDIDGPALAEAVFRAYLKQVLVDGLFHADPHPGNVFVTKDGCVALLDLGMVGHTTPGMQECLFKLLLAMSEGKTEQVTDVIVTMSQTGEDFDPVTFKRRISQLVLDHQGRELKQINVGRTLLEVTATAADTGLHVPSDLTLLGKTLLQLDEIGKLLDADFDPNAAIRRNVTELMTRRMNKGATQGSVLSSLLEVKGFLVGLPNRLNKIMDAVANHELEMKVRALDAPLVMEGLQKIANRVTSGLILAALIVGAALLMRVDTPFKVLGYPGLAILCFIAATTGGCWLLINIFVQDRRHTRQAR